MLEAEHLAGPAEAGDHLVHDEQGAQVAGEYLHGGQPLGGRHHIARGPLDGLHDQRRHRAQARGLDLLASQVDAGHGALGRPTDPAEGFDVFGRPGVVVVFADLELGNLVGPGRVDHVEHGLHAFVDLDVRPGGLRRLGAILGEHPAHHEKQREADDDPSHGVPR